MKTRFGSAIFAVKYNYRKMISPLTREKWDLFWETTSPSSPSSESPGVPECYDILLFWVCTQTHTHTTHESQNILNDGAQSVVLLKTSLVRAELN